jgi:general secretion pathway protein D
MVRNRVARLLAAAALLFVAGGGAPVGEYPGAATNGAGSITFSFDQVDVGTFVKLVGDITGRKFVVAEDVEGKKITVVSPRIAPTEVYSLFVSVLESVGCSVIEDGGIFRVVRLPTRDTPLATVVGVGDTIPADGVVTKIFRLEHVSAAEMRKVLEASIRGGKSGALGAVDETNHLIVTDTAENVRRVEKIVAEIDRPGLARGAEVVALRYAGAEDMAAEVNLAMAEIEGRGESLRRRLAAGGGAPSGSDDGAGVPYVVASPHANNLILVGTSTQIARLRDMIAKMDVDAQSGRGRLNAIFLNYLSAGEAAENIGKLLENSADKAETAKQRRRIAIQASPANNALLVDAAPGDLEVVAKLVEQLDRMPRQVHITVMIAEHSANDGLTLGVEMAAIDMPDTVGETVVQGGSLFKDGAESIMGSIQDGIFPRGISVGVASGSRVDSEGKIVTDHPAIINIEAIKTDSRFKILSETSLEAQNNREASVSIVNEIPILKSTVEGAGDNREVIRNIERIEVGIKLILTPQIIPGGEVRMELNPRIEAVIDAASAGTELTPTIARREVKTTVTVPDKRTIVIAGLTRDDKKREVKRVPILGDIPLLGFLFRHTVEANEKTDLLIFVTPRIVADLDEAEKIAQEWKTKTGIGEDESE